MSNYVFPLTLPGFSVTMTRSVETDTKVQTAASGKEWRTTYFTEPRYKYQIQWDFLRNGPSFRELDRVCDFVTRHMGAWDSFLLNDPEDNTALDQYIGVGDGVLTAFQLIRALDTSTDVRGGRFNSYGRPITNLCTYSAAIGDTLGWGFTAGTTVQKNFGLAPDGTQTASRISSAIHTSAGYSRVTSNSVVANYGPYAASCFIRAVGTNLPVYVQVGILSGSGDAATGAPVVLSGSATAVRASHSLGYSYFVLTDSEWCRLGVYLDPSDGVQAFGAGTLNLFVGTWPGHHNSNESILAWGAQIERGTQFGEYVGTTSAAVTQTGVLWPSIGGGSEPVYELRSTGSTELYGWPGQFGAARYQPQTLLTGLPVDKGAMDWQGQRYPYTGRINYLRSNADLSTSAWTATANGTGVAPTHKYQVQVAPDGTTAFLGSTMTFNRGSGTTSSDWSKLSQDCTGPTVPESVPMVFSAWMQPESGTAVLDIIEENTGASTTVTLDPNPAFSSARLTWQFTSHSSGACKISFRYRGDVNSAASRDIKIWGAALQTGTDPGHVMHTQAAALIEVPEVPDGLNLRVWDDYAHIHGTRLSPGTRTNLSAGFLSGSSAGGPDNDNSYTTISGTTTGTAFTPSTAVSGLGSATAGALFTSSAYFHATTGTGGTFGVQLTNTTDWTVDFTALGGTAGTITRAGSSVFSAYMEQLKNTWYRLVIVWSYPGSGTVTPYFSPAGGSVLTAYGMIETGVSDGGFPFTGSTQTDYTLANGVVTLALAAPLRTDQYLTWTGGFYKRVRLANDSLGADRIVNQIWSTQSIELISVKP